MSRSYLDLCKALVAELGIGGGSGPSSVTGQTGEMANVVRWIADADIALLNLWADWKFMWTAGPTGQVITAGAATGDRITSITDMMTEIEDGLVLNADTVNGYRPIWMSWEEFRLRFKTTPKRTQPRPTNWTVRPDGLIELSHFVLDNTAWTLEYQIRPERMTTNTQVSPIPTHFDRLIICRAALMYGGHEDAPEIISSMAAEHDDMLEKMESMYLPGGRNHRRHRNLNRPQPDIKGDGSTQFGGYG